jgi:hypothetical protein
MTEHGYARGQNNETTDVKGHVWVRVVHGMLTLHMFTLSVTLLANVLNRKNQKIWRGHVSGIPSCIPWMKRMRSWR